ncbi:MAG: HIT family protein [Candidatus Tritonobacter lacicola]|nr:HIT family protein [Candidatus Tritonobacter lacicola]
MIDCLFCNIEEQKIIASNDLAVAVPDGFPVTEGHTLIIPRRHEPDFLQMTSEELIAVWELAVELAARLRKDDPRITGFNMGANQGESAGQTVQHVHWHLIPRRDGDREDPTGGVRWIFPEKANYRKNMCDVKRVTWNV